MLRLAIFSFVGVFFMAGVASAQNISIGADAGYSRAMQGAGMNGVGVNVYGGYDLELGVIPEVQVGLHYLSKTEGEGDFEASESSMIIPIMLGVRYPIEIRAPVVPFVSAHLGAYHVRSTAEAVGITVKGSSTDIGINGGAGVEYALNEQIGVAAALWYNYVLNGDEGSKNVQLLTAALNVHMAL